MGRYLFSIPQSERYPLEALGRAQIIGLEGVPWTCSSALDEQQLIVTRHVDLSGRLLVPFSRMNSGIVHLLTGTLPESDHPWPIDRELTRGTLSRLRNQLSIWEESGLEIPESIRLELDQLVLKFSSTSFARSLPDREVTAAYDKLIERAVELITTLAVEFVGQLRMLSEQMADHIPVQTGISGDADAAGQLQIRMVERPVAERGEANGDTTLDRLAETAHWSRSAPSNEIRLAGPFVDFGSPVLPDSSNARTTFADRLAQAKSFCRESGARHGADLRFVHAIAGMNGVGQPNFNYPQQMQMTLEVIETLDRSFPGASIIASLDQPWGERLAMANGGIAALEIADTLLRYGTRLSAFGLEFNIGYWPQGTVHRDPLQWVDLIDRWSQFGIPLIVWISAPLGVPADLPTSRWSQTVCSDCLQPRFAEQIALIIELLASRPAVNAIIWKYPRDVPDSRFPLAGLLDEQGNVKPQAQLILKSLRELSGKARRHLH